MGEPLEKDGTMAKREEARDLLARLKELVDAESHLELAVVLLLADVEAKEVFYSTNCTHDEAEELLKITHEIAPKEAVQ